MNKRKNLVFMATFIIFERETHTSKSVAIGGSSSVDEPSPDSSRGPEAIAM
jgi:hypothetical protein